MVPNGSVGRIPTLSVPRDKPRPDCVCIAGGQTGFREAGGDRPVSAPPPVIGTLPPAVGGRRAGAGLGPDAEGRRHDDGRRRRAAPASARSARMAAQRPKPAWGRLSRRTITSPSRAASAFSSAAASGKKMVVMSSLVRAIVCVPPSSRTAERAGSPTATGGEMRRIERAEPCIRQSAAVSIAGGTAARSRPRSARGPRPSKSQANKSALPEEQARASRLGLDLIRAAQRRDGLAHQDAAQRSRAVGRRSPARSSAQRAVGVQRVEPGSRVAGESVLSSRRQPSGRSRADPAGGRAAPLRPDAARISVSPSAPGPRARAREETGRAARDRSAIWAGKRAASPWGRAAVSPLRRSAPPAKPRSGSGRVAHSAWTRRRYRVAAAHAQQPVEQSAAAFHGGSLPLPVRHPVTAPARLQRSAGHARARPAGSSTSAPGHPRRGLVRSSAISRGQPVPSPRVIG